MKPRARTAAIAAAAAAVAAAAWLLLRRPAEGNPPVPHALAADLTDVKGIGPVYRDRLASAGITDLDMLIAAGAAAVAEAADVVEAAAADWIAQATVLTGRQ